MNINIVINIGKNKYDHEHKVELDLECKSIDQTALESVVCSLVEAACTKAEIYKHQQAKKRVELPTELTTPPINLAAEEANQF